MSKQNVNIEEALKLVSESMQKPLPDEVNKSWTQSASATSGITAYDLEAPAKLLYPVITPLRNSTPRVGGGVGTAVNWRAITGINTNRQRIGVSEGNRGGVIAHTTADFTAKYVGIGLEDYVTFEADYAAQTFDDVKARAVTGTLQAMMIGEEQVILGGRGSGNTAMNGVTPSLTASTTGGSLGTETLSVVCVPLTLDGYLSTTVDVNGVPGQVTRVNADGSTDVFGGGSGKPSAAATVPVTGPNGSVVALLSSVPAGAVAFAWFWNTAGAERIGAVTTVPSVTITADAPSPNQLLSAIPGGASTDFSSNALVFDGLLTFILNPANNAYIHNMGNGGTAGVGPPLTAGTDGSIVEFDDALQHFWDKYKLSPDTIWVSSQEQRYIRSKILAAGAAAAQRFVFDVTQNRIMGGTIAMSYLNPFGMPAGQDYAMGTEIPIKVHPNMPPGTVMFTTSKLPYKLSNVNNILQIKTRRDYYQLEWPLVTRKYQYGVYADEVLQNYAPFAFGAITGIGPG